MTAEQLIISRPLAEVLSGAATDSILRDFLGDNSCDLTCSPTVRYGEHSVAAHLCDTMKCSPLFLR